MWFMSLNHKTNFFFQLLLLAFVWVCQLVSVSFGVSECVCWTPYFFPSFFGFVCLHFFWADVVYIKIYIPCHRWVRCGAERCGSAQCSCSNARQPAGYRLGHWIWARRNRQYPFRWLNASRMLQCSVLCAPICMYVDVRVLCVCVCVAGLEQGIKLLYLFLYSIQKFQTPSVLRKKDSPLSVTYLLLLTNTHTQAHRQTHRHTHNRPDGFAYLVGFFSDYLIQNPH